MNFYRCEECDKTFYSYNESLDLKCCDKTLSALDIESSVDNHNLNIKLYANYLIVDNKNIKNDIHFIEYIIIETNKGYYFKTINNSDSFKQFLLKDENIVDIYYYCNIHSVNRVNWDLIEISSDEEVPNTEPGFKTHE